jgi:sulfonate transport system permease protein
MASRIAAFLRGAAVPLILLAGLEWYARGPGAGSEAIAPPTAAALAFWRALLDGSLIQATAFTLLSAAVGLGLGFVAGTLLGIWLGLSTRAGRWSFLTVEVLRTVPSVALIPLSALVFGFGLWMDGSVVAFATFWPMLILAQAAARQVDPRLLEVANALSLSPLARTVKIVIPSMVPRLFVAFRLGVAIAMVVAVTVEIAANPRGLGYSILLAQENLDPALMLALVLWTAVVGYAANAFAMGLQRLAAGVMGGSPMKTWSVQNWLGSVLVLVLVLALWGLASSQQWVSKVFLPTPSHTWLSLEEGLRGGALLEQLLQTVRRMALGWFLACVVGTLFGAAVGTSAVARAWLQPTLEFLRPLPASATMPLAISIFGLSSSMVLFVVAFGAMWPVLLSTLHGFAKVEPRLHEVADALELPRYHFIWKVGLPSAMPDILAGMRLSMTVSLIVTIVGEMIASQSGLGQAILMAARTYRSSDLFAGIALLGLIGFSTNAVLAGVERKLLRWQRP